MVQAEPHILLQLVGLWTRMGRVGMLLSGQCGKQAAVLGCCAPRWECSAAGMLGTAAGRRHCWDVWHHQIPGRSAPRQAAALGYSAWEWGRQRARTQGSALVWHDEISLLPPPPPHQAVAKPSPHCEHPCGAGGSRGRKVPRLTIPASIPCTPFPGDFLSQEHALREEAAKGRRAASGKHFPKLRDCWRVSL